VPSPDVEVFQALERAFGRLGLRWYVFGAQAAILYGVARLTEDVDVTVDPAGHATDEIVASLRAEGLALRIGEPVEPFVKRTRVLPMAHLATDLPVDVVLAGPGIEELFFDHATIREVGDGVEVPAASAEDVVVMKILAGRPKDLEDAATILAAGGEGLDHDRMERTLRLIERALDQSDLLPRLRELAKGRCR